MRSSDPADSLPSPDLESWRALMIGRLVWIGFLASLPPSLLLLVEALRSGQWRNAVACGCVIGILAAVSANHRWPHRWRALVAVAMFYAAGTWLLVQGSVVGPLHLLACPMMTVLTVGLRPAMAALALCVSTLVLVGWQLQIPFPTASGLAGGGLVRWLNIGANLGMLGLLLTLTCAFLLRKLEASLAQQREAAQSLRQSEQRLSEVAAQVPGMIYRIRIGNGFMPQFLYASPGSQDLLGLDPQTLLQDSSQVARLLHPDDVVRLRAHIAAAQTSADQLALELRLCRPGQPDRWVQLQSTEVDRDADGVVHNGIMTDITERKRGETLVWRQAHFDSLTGLPNRLMQQQVLAQALDDSRRTGRPLALMLIDLDRFKDVNDALGHARGDQLLVQATERLRHCVRDGDTVARMGGDEFTVLLPGLVDAADAEVVGHRVLTALTQAFQLDTEQAYVSASIGVALYPGDANNLDDLLKHADQAMYLAKEGGRNRMCRFTPALKAQAQQRMRLGNDLRAALDKRELRVMYQPIVDLATGQVRKAEALLRWHHPELGEVSPAQFIPIAEVTGLIGEIGDWVLRSAAQQVKHWRTRLHPDFQISVNRSPMQFGEHQAPDQPWPEVLAGMGLPAQAIEVEITEGLLLDSSPMVAAQLQALREAGMPVSLDDFGTGYSALAYLHRFKLDTLKIDRSFVSGLSAGDTGRTLCRAMVLMAHELGMQVVAEGVETAEQRDWLKTAGCDLGQGYFWTRPMAPEALEAWVAQRGQAAYTPAPLPLTA